MTVLSKFFTVILISFAIYPCGTSRAAIFGESANTDHANEKNNSSTISGSLSASSVSSTSSISSNDSIASSEDKAISEMIDKNISAIVSISATQKSREAPSAGNNPLNDPREFFRYFFEREFGGGNREHRRDMQIGSGFIIDPAGYIITSNHVIDGADQIMVAIGDETRKIPAKIIGRDPRTDVALLKIDINKKLPYIKFGDSNAMKVGYRVFAFGNPWGVGTTVTSGIISAKERVVDELPIQQYFIQTDAPLNSGNSGGPLCDRNGEVIGVNTAIVTPSGGNIGIGFAVPISVVKNVAEKLKKGGAIERGWLGVKIASLDENAMKSIKSDSASGVIVVSVVSDSPAEKAGIKVGDIVTKVNNRNIQTAHELTMQIADTPIDSIAQIEVMRNKKLILLPTKIAKIPESIEKSSADPEAQNQAKKPTDIIIGITCAPLSQESRAEYNISKDIIDGVVVTYIDDKSLLFQNGLRKGDIIISVNQEIVKNMSDIKRVIKDAKKTGGYIALLYKRDYKNNIIVMPLSE